MMQHRFLRPVCYSIIRKGFLSRKINASPEECFDGLRCRNRNSSSSPPSKTAGKNLGLEDAFNENQRARLELAVAYRALDRYGLNEGVCNHLSLMAPARNGKGEVMLMAPYGKHWSRVTRSCLVGIDEAGETVEGEGQMDVTATSIQRGLHLVNKKAVCVIHTHAPYVTALGMLKNPELLICHQISTRFIDIAYDRDYNGYAYELDEGKRLAEKLGSKDVLMMCNHGVITVGKTVALALDSMYYLERACMFQILAMSTGKELSIIPDKLVKFNHDAFNKDAEHYADAHFKGITEVIMTECPDVAN